MIDANKKRVYSEVYGVLECMGDSYKNAIPKQMYNFIEEHRDKNYVPTYDIESPLSNQNLSQKATAFICMLHYNYWCENEEEKEKIRKILEYNEKKNREKYDVNNIFKEEKKQIISQNEKSIKEETSLVEYKESILKKIINKLKSWFK